MDNDKPTKDDFKSLTQDFENSIFNALIRFQEHQIDKLGETMSAFGDAMIKEAPKIVQQIEQLVENEKERQ